MLIDLSSASGLPPIDADICVIGAGAAGLQMARRLVDRGLKVCLAESGGLDFEQATQDLYRGANLGMPYYEQANAIFDVGEFNYENDVWKVLGQPDPGLDPAELDVKLWRFDEVMERFTAGRARDLFDAPNLTVLLHANATKRHSFTSSSAGSKPGSGWPRTFQTSFS